MSNRELLGILDKMIADRNTYYDRRKVSADSLKRLIAATINPEDKLPLYLERGRIWSGLSSDSAISVLTNGLNLSRQVGDSTYVQLFRIYLAQSYFNRGQMLDGLADLRSLAAEGVIDSVRLPFHHAAEVLCYILGFFYPDNTNTPAYLQKGLNHAREEVKYVVNDSVYRKYCEAQVYLGEGKWDLMALKLHEVIKDAPADVKYRGLAHTL
ncbi:MAG: hypothetical protein K2K77_04810, partial [Duncaniella sp.]|nr:hypothetical protein [Duncaniella sp.]